MKKVTVVTFYIILSYFGLQFFSACNNGDSGKSDELDSSLVDSAKIDDHTRKVKKIFYNVPSPIEMAGVLQRSGALYRPELLNPVKNVENYITVSQQALNLGVYGSDLSYVRMFDQIQLAVNYLSGIKKICDNLNIPEEEGSFAVARLENNIENRDSLLQIISETYAAADAYLKDNDRGNTATMVVLGGWVEALYLATNIINPKNTQNRIIIERIGEQKLSLNNLIELLKTYPEDADLQAYLPDLESLRQIFEEVEINYTQGEVTTDATKKLTTIHTKADVTISDETVKKIQTKILEVRKKIVNF